MRLCLVHEDSLLEKTEASEAIHSAVIQGRFPKIYEKLEFFKSDIYSIRVIKVLLEYAYTDIVQLHSLSIDQLHELWKLAQVRAAIDMRY